MPDLLNEIDRRLKYLGSYLPPARRRITNEERADALLALHNRVQTGLATETERQKYDRCMEILRVAKARNSVAQLSPAPAQTAQEITKPSPKEKVSN